MRSRWLITPPVLRGGLSDCCLKPKVRLQPEFLEQSSWGGGLGCVFITVNSINNRAIVQEEAKFLNWKYAQALSASVERCFYLL